MRRSIFTARFLVGLLALSFFACTAPKPADAANIALVFDKGGKDDRSFNSSAYQGAQEAKAKLGVPFKYVEASDDHSFETFIREYAKKDFDLIIAVGTTQQDAIRKVAPQFPNKKFLIVDAKVDLPNVASALFQEHEGSFMAGVAAGLATKTKVVGFIGGMDIPLIRRFQMGYDAGFKYIQKSGKVISNYIGISGEAWHNPPRAKELALSQISQGADVIFHAAGASGSGLFDAAAEKNIYAIGVDSNQNWVKPGRVLTSMLKRVDQAVYKTIEAVQKNEFKAGVHTYGLKDDGIDLAMDQYNEKLFSPEQKKQLNDIKKQIIAGKIKVPDYYQSQK